MIPITKPEISEDEINEIADSLRSGWLVQGPKVEQFEKKIASLIGVKEAVATSSCTTALHLCLILLDIGKDDEVIVPSLSFIATANIVMYVGAKPIFAEVDPQTYNLDPADFERKISSKTKAVIAAHQAGLGADMPKILKIAKKHKLKVIEDAAPGLGAAINGKMIGTFGDLSCFSFHPRKNITTAEGGMITTNNKKLADLARILRSHGASISDRHRHKADKFIQEHYPVLGFNYRMSDIHASIGLAQFKKLKRIENTRKKLAERYNKFLAKNKYLILPYTPKGFKHTYQQYFIQLTSDAPLNQIQVIQKLKQKDIGSRIGIMATHLEPYYKKMYPNLKLPVTEQVSNHIISLPLYPSMALEEQDKVINTLSEILM